MMNEIMGRNITLKITLTEKRKKKWRKFKRKKRAVKWQIGSSKVSDFVELALQRPTFSNVTDNRKQRKKERIGLQKEKIRLDQLVNSEFERENISKTPLAGQRYSLNSDVVSQSNGIITLEKNIILREGEIEVSSIKTNIGQEKEEKTIAKPLAVENGDKVKLSKTEKARNERSIVEQFVLMADKEIGKTELSQNDSSLVDILASLLDKENSVTALTPPPPISTTGLIYTHRNCTPCSEIGLKIPEQDVQDKYIDSNCTSCTGVTTEGSEKIVQNRAKSQGLKGYFCADTVFNLSQKVLTETEMKVLEIGLGFSPTPNLINETDPRRNFENFSRKMRCRWYFRNEPSDDFSNGPAFRPRFQWKPPTGHPCVELFLSRLEKELFSFLPGKTQSYNLTKEEWKAMRNLSEDRSIITKLANKGSCVVIWDREDYLAEGYRQHSDHSTYTDINKFNQKPKSDLTERSNRIFKGLCNKKLITEKELKYFSFNFKNACCSGKVYLLPKIHKRLFEVPGRPVISNCGTPTESVRVFRPPSSTCYERG